MTKRLSLLGLAGLLALIGLWLLGPGTAPKPDPPGTHQDAPDQLSGGSSPTQLQGIEVPAAPGTTPGAQGNERTQQEGGSAELRIQLRNAEGPPAAGVVLQLERLDLAGEGLQRSNLPATQANGMMRSQVVGSGLFRVLAPAAGIWMATTRELLIHRGELEVEDLMASPEGETAVRLGAMVVDIRDAERAAHLELVRPAGGLILGQLRSHSEVPIAGARIVLASHKAFVLHEGELVDATPAAHTLEDGSFRFEGVRPGGVSLRVEVGGEVLVIHDAGRLHLGETLEPTIRTAASLVVVGHVADVATGAPSEGQAYLVERAVLDRSLGHLDIASHPVPERGILGHVPLVRGDFRLVADGARGDLAVVLTGPDFRTTILPLETVEAIPTIDLGAISPLPMGRLQGRILAAPQLLESGVRLTLRGIPGSAWSVPIGRADADGSFDLELAFASTELDVSVWGCSSTRAPLDRDQEVVDLDVRLDEPPAWATIETVDSEGVPHPLTSTVALLGDGQVLDQRDLGATGGLLCWTPDPAVQYAVQRVSAEGLVGAPARLAPGARVRLAP